MWNPETQFSNDISEAKAAVTSLKITQSHILL